MRHAHLALAFALAACSAGDGNMTGGNNDLTGTVVDQAGPGGYPAGPYGTAVGDTLRDFGFKGWFTPEATSGLANDTANGAMYADVRFDDARKSGKKIALVMFAGFH